MAEKELVEFEVVADALWHSSECRPYKKGDIVKLPADTKVTPESSIRRLSDKPKAKANGKADKESTDQDQA